MSEFREVCNKACLSFGIPSLSTDTCARIMAVLYIHGGAREAFTFNTKLIADIKYIQERFKLNGGEVVDAEFAGLVGKYSDELEEYIDPRLRFRSTPATRRYTQLHFRLISLQKAHKDNLDSIRKEIDAIKDDIDFMERAVFYRWNPKAGCEQFPKWSEKLFMEFYNLKL